MNSRMDHNYWMARALTLARRGVETTAVVDVNQIVTDYLTSPEFSIAPASKSGMPAWSSLPNTYGQPK